MNIAEILDSYDLSTRNAAKVLEVGVASINNWKADPGHMSERSIALVQAFVDKVEKYSSLAKVQPKCIVDIVLTLKKNELWKSWVQVELFLGGGVKMGSYADLKIDSAASQFISSNVDKLERGLTLVDPKRWRTRSSFDILCQDSAGNVVAIELKNGMIGEKQLAQILKTKAKLTESYGASSRLFLICSQVLPGLRKPLEQIKGLSVFLINIEKVVY